MNSTLIVLIAGIIIGAVIIAGGYFAFVIFRKKRMQASLSMALFLVKIPRGAPSKDQEKKDFKEEVDRFEQLLGNFSSFKTPIAFELAVPHVGEEIHFYVAVPKKHSEVTAKQIQGIWSGASVEKVVDDYNVFNPQGSSAGAYLRQKDNSALPIRTYEQFDSDPFLSILGGLSKINEVGEGAAFQLLIRPAKKSAKKNLRRIITKLKRGEPLEKAISTSGFKEIKKAFNTEEERKEKEEKVIDEEAVKALEVKVSKPLFEVNARIIASGASDFQANDVLEGVAAGFEQFSAPERNAFTVVKRKNPKKLFYQFIFRQFDSGKSMMLTSEEVASIYHFPLSNTDTPRVKWLKSREAPPPAEMPKEGTLLGESVFRGENENVFITDDDRRRHVYTIGQTGTGKSTFMASMIISDIKRGRGVAMVDPHGDLVETALEHIPPERMDDVIVFDPGDLSRPLGLNMLDYNLSRPEERTFIVNEMQSIFNKLFPPETMGPMFEQYMRNALLLLMEDMVNEPTTLIEMPRLFTDTEYRERKLNRINNPVVIDFWEKEAIKAQGEGSLANMTPYITSKFNNFISNDYMRPIIGQPKSAFNFRKVMDEQKILLVNLSKGRIGDINAGLLGMIMTGKILMSALSRVDIPQSERKDFSLYIDEFQNFSTDSIGTILSEARKYALNLTVAHQFIAQLEEDIRDAVFGNVGTQVVFRVGAQDAEFLVKQFDPVFTENDLVNIDNYNAYVKLLINGQTSKPFNMHTFPVPQGNTELAEQIKEMSRTKYGTKREEVEKDIHRRLRQ